ncbi:MAG TPA: NmrA/HSCARG family protein [Anaerolineae bacterium]
MDGRKEQLIVVTGATGQQGGAVVRHLLAAAGGPRVRALTRDPGKPAAQALAKAGAEVVAADNDDRRSLDAAFQGAYGVYSVQNFWLPNVGAEGEVRQGKAIADAAKAAGVKHLVYASVGAAHRGKGQAHFATKHEIERYVRALDIPHTILRPAAFMENFNWQRPQITNGTFTGMGLRAEKGRQMVAVDDVGGFASLIFGAPERFLGQTVELSGDELTEAQIAETFARVIGRPVRLAAPQGREGAVPAREQLAMFEFFNDEGYDADIAALRRVYPPLKTLEQWLRATGWENAEPLPIPAERGGWG